MMRRALFLVSPFCFAAGLFAQSPAVTGVASVTFNGAPAVAPGSLVAIFGTNLAASFAQADSVPWSASRNGVTVSFNGVQAPIYQVSPTLVNVQLPWEIGSGTVNVFVSNNGITSAAFPMQVTPISPGIFPVPVGNQFFAAAVDNGPAGAGPFTYPWPAGSVSGAALAVTPAKAGDIVSIYSTGLGPVDPPVKTGSDAQDGQNHTPTTSPLVLIGGVQAQVLGSVYIPQYVGLELINVKVPTGVTGTVPIQIQSGGVTSTSNVLIAIQ